MTIGPIRRTERRKTKQISNNREQLSELGLAAGILAVVAAVMLAF